jgi:hypothetical protein
MIGLAGFAISQLARSLLTFKQAAGAGLLSYVVLGLLGSADSTPRGPVKLHG